MKKGDQNERSRTGTGAETGETTLKNNSFYSHVWAGRRILFNAERPDLCITPDEIRAEHMAMLHGEFTPFDSAERFYQAGVYAGFMIRNNEGNTEETEENNA